MEGSHIRQAVATLAAVAVAGAAATGCSGEDSGADTVQPVVTDDPARMFAPLISLHPSEQWRPTSPIDFVARSTLRWLDGKCGDAQLAAGQNAGSGLPGAKSEPPPPGVAPLDQLRLATTEPLFSHTAGEPPGCKAGRTFTTGDYTRPHDPQRPDGIRMDQGFALDPADEKRPGRDVFRDPDGTRWVPPPVTFELRPERHAGEPAVRITYWLLFGMHRPPGRSAAVAALAHEGDWERVSVLLHREEGKNRYTPISIRYYRVDGAHEDVPWQSVPHVRWRFDPAERTRIEVLYKGGNGTHPIVFAARGSHTPYPKPGRYRAASSKGGAAWYDETSACPDCLEWRGWYDLMDMEAQYWYGYGGGWGYSPTRPIKTALGPSKWIARE